MRGYFDEGPEESKPGRRDAELTLGGGTLLAIFFGLVLLCGLCFGLGYEVGRNGATAMVTLPAGTPAKTASVAPSAPAASSKPQAASAPATAAAENPAPQSQEPALPAVQLSVPSSAQPKAAPQPQPKAQPPAPAQSATHAPQTSASSASAAGSAPLMVQIAAVANPEDGDVLVAALRKHGYSVSARREGDNLIHVRIGPFTSRDEANRWRQKLLSDGYNAQVQ
ncbi:SPOR domain-containing protein [Telmatobacter bradus]|uniref:SPOR domain-containing protein n=1 Tax=Telmatobacter bradus TaxID=474953 RepID=UPI003B43028D